MAKLEITLRLKSSTDYRSKHMALDIPVTELFLARAVWSPYASLAEAREKDPDGDRDQWQITGFRVAPDFCPRVSPKRTAILMDAFEMDDDGILRISPGLKTSYAYSDEEGYDQRMVIDSLQAVVLRFSHKDEYVQLRIDPMAIGGRVAQPGRMLWINGLYETKTETGWTTFDQSKLSPKAQAHYAKLFTGRRNDLESFTPLWITESAWYLLDGESAARLGQFETDFPANRSGSSFPSFEWRRYQKWFLRNDDKIGVAEAFCQFYPSTLKLVAKPEPAPVTSRRGRRIDLGSEAPAPVEDPHLVQTDILHWAGSFHGVLGFKLRDDLESYVRFQEEEKDGEPALPGQDPYHTVYIARAHDGWQFVFRLGLEMEKRKATNAAERWAALSLFIGMRIKKEAALKSKRTFMFPSLGRGCMNAVNRVPGLAAAMSQASDNLVGWKRSGKLKLGRLADYEVATMPLLAETPNAIRVRLTPDRAQWFMPAKHFARRMFENYPKIGDPWAFKLPEDQTQDEPSPLSTPEPSRPVRQLLI